MQKGWNAKGLLQPHWGRVGGRDALARLVGMQPATVSGYNTGRLNMTLQAARRLALALDISIFDLGAPADPERSNPLLSEIKTMLEGFEIAIARQLKAQADLLATLTAVAAEIARSVDPPAETAAPPRRSRKRRPA